MIKLIPYHIDVWLLQCDQMYDSVLTYRITNMYVSNLFPPHTNGL